MNSSNVPIFFLSQNEFRNWLETNFNLAKEIYVGFYKAGSGKQNMTWSQSVDQALCFGWIDGIRHSIDSESYSIRFTPRNPKSIWSEVNIKKVENLIKQGLMKPNGLTLFKNRKENKSEIYSYERAITSLSAEYEKQFKNNGIAWNNFQLKPPSYRKTAINWVMSAKQRATQQKRLAELIADSEKKQNVKPLSRNATTKKYVN